MPGKKRERGQSVVEFALVLPIMVFLMLAVIDFARIFTTMLSVESAAREAADFGTFGSQKWNDAIVTMPVDGTEAKMHHRACVASSDLPDYVGPDESCTNPSFSYELSLDKGATWVPYSPGLGCDDATREPPCWLKVTLSYDFRVIVPLNLQFLDISLGLPSTLTFERESIFAMTDLALP
jgi:TadE-like protein